MKRLFYAVVFLNTLNVLSTYAVRNVDSAAWLVFFGGIAGGMMILPLMTGAAVMTAGSGVEGTLFALLMGLYNLSQIAWGFLGGKLLPSLGLWGLVTLATLIQLSAYFLIPHMDTTFPAPGAGKVVAPANFFSHFHALDTYFLGLFVFLFPRGTFP